MAGIRSGARYNRLPLERLTDFEGVGVCYAATQMEAQACAGKSVVIGAKPSTEWLGGQLAEDDDGFLLTGTDIPVSRLEGVHHAPLLLETSRPGIFCVGDPLQAR